MGNAVLGAMLVLFAFVPLHRAAGQDGPSLIILVRHAEKAAVPGADPPLSDEGKVRAAALAASLSHTLVNAIVTSTYMRTFETAAVVARDRNVTVQKIGLDGGTGVHVAAVAAAVRAQKGVVLVVGHSNTIPALVAALGGPKLPDICDAHYARMFVLHPSGATPPSLTIASYGSADPVAAPACAGMSTR